MPMLTQLKSRGSKLVPGTQDAFLDLALAFTADTQASANIILLALGCKLQGALHIGKGRLLDRGSLCVNVIGLASSNDTASINCQCKPGKLTIVLGTACRGTQAVRMFPVDKGK